MDANKTARRPWRSGFCNQSNPPDSHGRCPVSHHAPSGPRFCCCDCHAVKVETHTPTGVLVTDGEPESPEWFAARRGGITGTDLPKILGITKYGNALSVWLDKRDELDDDGAGEAARWGNLLEDPVAREWAERHDTTVGRVGVLRHLDHEWMRASLDRLVWHCPDGSTGERGEPVVCGLEVKTRSAFKASDWRDGTPDDVLAQTTWGLMVTGFDHMHVAALIGGQRLESYRVDRDPKLEQYLLDAAEPVWRAVREGVPPEAHPDAEGVLLDLLDRIYTTRSGAVDLEPVAAQQWLDQYAAGGDLEKEGKRLKTQAKTALVQMLDDGDTGLIDDAPVFTYKRPEPGTAMPAAEVRRLQSEQPDVFEELSTEGFITTTNPSPRFDLKKRATKEASAA